MKCRWFATKQTWIKPKETIIDYCDFLVEWKKNPTYKGAEFHKIHFSNSTENASGDEYRNLIIPQLFGFISKKKGYLKTEFTEVGKEFLSADYSEKEKIYIKQLHKFFFNSNPSKKEQIIKENILPIAFLLEVIKGTDNYVEDIEIRRILTSYEGFSETNLAIDAIIAYRAGERDLILSKQDVIDIRFMPIFKETHFLNYDQINNSYSLNKEYFNESEEYINFAKEFSLMSRSEAVAFQESNASAIKIDTKVIDDAILGELTNLTKSEVVEQIDFQESYTEGNVIKKHIYIEKRERNRKIVKDLKQDHRNKNDGRMPCQECGYDFREHGFIDYCEAHHSSVDFSEQKGITEVRKEDFELLCPNCHKKRHLKLIEN